MTRLSLVFVVLVACSGGTASSPSQIFAHREHGYSVGHPDGWVTSEDLGATRFASPIGKQTIVVRSAPRPNEIVEGKPTNIEDVVEATRAALQRLTRVELSTPARLDGGEFPGARFSFTFNPQSTQRAYQRTHVVLLGQRHLFHVIQTSPVGEKLDEQAMQAMVATLVEEE